MNTQPEALRLADALRNLHEAKKYHPTGPGGQMCGSEQYRLITSGLAFEDLQNAAAELRRLHEENKKLKTVMVAAAEEISSRWDAHCDEEGYGPVNLLRRLEEGVAVDYWYTAGAFLDLERKLIRLRETNTELVEALNGLFWYVNQLEIIVYSADDIGEHEIVVKAKAAITKATGEQQ